MCVRARARARVCVCVCVCVLVTGSTVVPQQVSVLGFQSLSKNIYQKKDSHDPIYQLTHL